MCDVFRGPSNAFKWSEVLLCGLNSKFIPLKPTLAYFKRGLCENLNPFPQFDFSVLFEENPTTFLLKRNATFIALIYCLITQKLNIINNLSTVLIN